MPKVAIAIIAALEREVSGLTKEWVRVEREHQGRNFLFLRREEHEREQMIVVCGGIGLEAARRAAEAAIALYRPNLVQSVGFAGALDASLHVGDVFVPAVVIDARDGSRTQIEGTHNHGGSNQGTLVTFMGVAGVDQKASLAQAYGAQAVDMEASAVAAAAHAHEIPFAAIKAISDESNFEMPQTARFIDSQGQFRTASFAFFAALRPWLWPRVAQLASNSRKAANALSQHLQRLQQELSQASKEATENIAATSVSSSPEITASGSRLGGHE
jgi:adenosylhomocysteine nucleosidase